MTSQKYSARRFNKSSNEDHTGATEEDDIILPNINQPK